MNIRPLAKIVMCLLLSATTLSATAQQSSPTIAADKSVTFRLHAPNAEQVQLLGTMLPEGRKIKTPAGAFGKQGEVDMTPTGDGWWQHTVENVASGLYTYAFSIDDGEQQTDPLNPNKMREGNEHISFFIVGGGAGDDFADRNVPHGIVGEAWYPSTLEAFEQRRMMVYLPKAYSTDDTTRFPVLYLLHGSGGDEESWLDCGRLAQVMDNLIAQQRCVPMIVVMPNGIANRAAAPGKDPNQPEQKSASVNIESMMGSIEAVFMNDIVAFVDNNFRTIATKSHRAIAGLSLGGLQTIFITANNPTAFDYIGLFSAQASNAMSEKNISRIKGLTNSWNSMAEALPFLKKSNLGKKINSLTSGVTQGHLDIYDDFDEKLAKQFATPPALYYITLGKDDFVKKLNDDLREKLDEKKYKYVYAETDGGHTWDNWRAYIVDFLPKLFR